MLCAECGYGNVKYGKGYWGPSKQPDRRDTNWCNLRWRKTVWNGSCSLGIRDFDLKDGKEVCPYCGQKKEDEHPLFSFSFDPNDGMGGGTD